MKNSGLAAVAILVSGMVAYSQDATEERPINTDELNKRPVVGELGLPLGTATEIHAEIISGRELRQKGYNSLYLLKVTRVAGKKMNNAPRLKFSIPSFVRVNLARHNFDLYELKTGEKTGSLSSKQIEKLEEGYIGKTVRLVVYEVGSFSGIPRNLPKDVPIWADFGFHFSTSLVVLAERD